MEAGESPCGEEKAVGATQDSASFPEFSLGPVGAGSELTSKLLQEK